MRPISFFFIAGLVSLLSAQNIPSVDKGSWGKEILKGINCGTKIISDADLKRMKSWGVGVLRIQLVGEQFRPVETEGKWTFTAEGWESLDGILARAKAAGLRGIVDLHRGTQGDYYPNEHADPKAISAWEDPMRFEKLASVWCAVVSRYREDREVIAGYDLFNEPHPPYSDRGYSTWNKVAKGLTKRIREIDRFHTLVVECAEFAEPGALRFLEPTGDPNTVYSFHCYRPHEFCEQGTRANWPFGDDGKSGYVYPGIIPLGWSEKAPVMVDRSYLEKALDAVIEFQKKYEVRIWVGEFGVVRWAPARQGEKHGSAYNYLKDCLEIFTREGWDWTLHSYRDSDKATFSIDLSTDRNDNKSYESTDRLELLKDYWSGK